VPCLILLNGPPGIGKSTIAERYVDEHSGTLNLDIDRLRSLIGGWREDFQGAGEIVRPLALALATTHLRSGRDVIMPQYLGRIIEIERFEAAVVACEADFLEIVLMDSLSEALRRFTTRSEDSEQPWHEEIRLIVQRSGGEAHLTELYQQLTTAVDQRPDAVTVVSDDAHIEQTYCRVLQALTDLTR